MRAHCVGRAEAGEDSDHAGWLKAKRALALCAVVPALGLATPVFAQQQGQLFAPQEQGYGRLILAFPGVTACLPMPCASKRCPLSIEFDEKSR